MGDGWVAPKHSHTFDSECHETCPAYGKDRGVFGMPGVGHDVVPPGVLDRDLVTHPPDTGLWSDWPLAHGKMIDLSGVPNVTTALARRIVDRHMPEALAHFLARNAEYGDDDDFNLGVAGQYVDISRKVQKLKRRWWDGTPAADGAESDQVIVMELIGHLLMSLDMMEQEDAEVKGEG